MTLVSSEPGTEPVVAGTAPSSQPSLSADGQLVGFVTKARTCSWSRRRRGRGHRRRPVRRRCGSQHPAPRHDADDGVRPAVARTRALSSATPVGPSCSTRWLRRSSSRAARLAVRSSAISTAPTLSLADADLGTTLVGFTSDEWYVAVINDGPTTFTPSLVRVSDARFRSTRRPVRAHSACRCRRVATARSGSPSPRPTRTGHGALSVSEEGFRAVSVSTSVRGSRRRTDTADQPGRPPTRSGRGRPDQRRVPVRRREHLADAHIGGVDPRRRRTSGLRHHFGQLRRPLSIPVRPAASASHSARPDRAVARRWSRSQPPPGSTRRWSRREMALRPAVRAGREITAGGAFVAGGTGYPREHRCRSCSATTRVSG